MDLSSTLRSSLTFPGHRWADSFSEGRALVWKLDLYGFIDQRGVWIVPPELEDAGRFAEGLAPVEVGGKWGYIDLSGSMVLEPQFDEARSFSQDLAAVRWGDSWGYIRKDGAWAIEPRFVRALELQNKAVKQWQQRGGAYR